MKEMNYLTVSYVKCVINISHMVHVIALYDMKLPCAHNLKNHTRSVHKDIREYKCGKCPKSYTRSRTLKSHIRSCHPKKCDS